MDKDERNWIKYSSLGIEMAVIIGFFVWGGVSIDNHREATFPLFTLIMSLLGLTVAMIRLFRGLK